MSNLEENKIQDNKTEQGKFASLLAVHGFLTESLKNTADNIEIILVKPENLVEIVSFLKNTSETQLDLLFSVMGTDKPEYFEMIYHLYSSKFNDKLMIKSYLDKTNPEIDSLTAVYSAADWHEREAYDLLGLKFNNHPDLRRILLPDDWKGHPLRKDYTMDDPGLSWNER